MFTGISGTAMLTPLVILAFPLIGVPTLGPAQAVGMALFTEFFGFLSGWIGYSRAGLIDYKAGWKLVRVGVPVIIVFSLVSHFIPSIFLKGAYGGMMMALFVYLLMTAKANVRNRELSEMPEAVEQIPRVAESQKERVVRARRGGEYRQKVCDGKRGYMKTSAGGDM